MALMIFNKIPTEFWLQMEILTLCEILMIQSIRKDVFLESMISTLLENNIYVFARRNKSIEAMFAAEKQAV